MKLQARGFSRQNFRGIIVNNILLFISRQFHPMVELVKHRIEIETSHSFVSTTGIHSDIYRGSVFRLWGLRKTHIFVCSSRSTYCLCQVLYLSIDARPLGCCKELWPQAAVLDWLGVHRNIVQPLWIRHRETEVVHGWLRSRRPRVTLHGRGVYTRETYAPAFRLLATYFEAFPGNNAISTRTVCNRFWEHNIRPERPSV